MDKPIAADWAIELAMKETDLFDPLFFDVVKKAPTSFLILHALARYIEKHEKPPVDPDRVIVEEILKSWYRVPNLTHMFDMNHSLESAVAKFKELKNG